MGEGGDSTGRNDTPHVVVGRLPANIHLRMGTPYTRTSIPPIRSRARGHSTPPSFSTSRVAVVVTVRPRRPFIYLARKRLAKKKRGESLRKHRPSSTRGENADLAHPPRFRSSKNALPPSSSIHPQPIPPLRLNSFQFQSLLPPPRCAVSDVVLYVVRTSLSPCLPFPSLSRERERRGMPNFCFASFLRHRGALCNASTRWPAHFNAPCLFSTDPCRDYS